MRGVVPRWPGLIMFLMDINDRDVVSSMRPASSLGLSDQKALSVAVLVPTRCDRLRHSASSTTCRGERLWEMRGARYTSAKSCWQIADPPSQEGAPIDVDGVEFQTNLQATIGQIASGYRELGITGVAVVNISLIRVLNLRLTRPRPTSTPGIDRPFLHLPDIRLADMAEPQAGELKPSLDALWRAAGWSSGLTLTV